MVAIFRDQRHRVDTSGVSDLHRTKEITLRDRRSDGLAVDSPQHDPHLTADKGRSRTLHDKGRSSSNG